MEKKKKDKQRIKLSEEKIKEIIWKYQELLLKETEVILFLYMIKL
jgi:hypothetical protein